MARPLDQAISSDAAAIETEVASSRIDRAAARAFAAAVSALLISTFVVSQSTGAIDPDGTVAGNSVAAGTVSLTDDDGGRSLVNLDAMSPDQPVEECITVTYGGTILPVGLTLDTQTVGDLEPYLAVSIERGSGGSFGECDDFEASEQIFSGSLKELDERGAMPLGSIYNSGAVNSFRFEFVLANEAEAVGRQSSIDFVWEAAP